MELSFNEILGSRPELYARKVTRERGFKHPPICEKQIAAHLGLKIKPFDGSREPSLRKELQTCCSWLESDSRIIRINTDVSPGRQRLGVVHECSHDLIPWHRGLNHFSSAHEVDGMAHKQTEQEAFRCGIELLMPTALAMNDILSMPIGTKTIRLLSNRYEVSLEATSIKYARVHPSLVGILVVEPWKDVSGKHSHPRLGSQLPLFPHDAIRTIPPRTAPRETHALRAKYFVRSRRFPIYIRPGTGIDEENVVFKSWELQQPSQGELRAAAIGSSTKFVFNAECMPLSYGDMVLVLLWLPDRQLEFNSQGRIGNESSSIRASFI